MNSIAFAVLLAAAPAPAQPDRNVDDDLKQVLAIDDEIAAIGRNAATLAGNRGARFDEINSLKLRYPEIEIPPNATVADVVKALRKVRAARAAQAMPAMEARVRQANDAYCKARAALFAKRTEMEATDDYKRMSLDDRLALRRAIDDLIAANKPDGLDCDAR